MISKILVSIGSLSTMGFGIWHFFVPKIWNWYSYIKSDASELVAAVRAINVFFSLSLVLIGTGNLIFLFADNKLGLITMLSISCILWATRVAMQIFYPQGSIKPTLQYGMLAAFIVVFICFAISLLITLLTYAD